MRLPGDDARPLGIEEETVEAVRQRAILELLFADTEEERQAASDLYAQLRDARPTPAEYRDALHVPEDAGELRDGLVRVLRRIPDGRGRWISCQRGWYCLVAEAEERMAAVAPDVVIHLVTQRFGTLLVEWALPVSYSCCIAFEETLDDPLLPTSALDACFAEHRRTAEHFAEERRRADVVLPLGEIAADVAERSRRLCERTGGPGILMVADGYFEVLDPLVASDDALVCIDSGEADDRWLPADRDALAAVAARRRGEIAHLDVVAARLRAALGEQFPAAVDPPQEATSTVSSEIVSNLGALVRARRQGIARLLDALRSQRRESAAA